MRLKSLLLFCCLLSFPIAVKANFDVDSRCAAAYKAIFDLKLTEAASIIRDEKQQNPQNGIIILLENYVNYYTLLASESKADYDKYKDRRSDRLSALEKNSENSPYYLYSQAQVYLQWSFLKAKFGDYMSSAFDAKKANSLLKDNVEKYPDFLPNQVSLALVNVIFGSIPASFRGITRFLGMSGNVQAGIKQLEQLRATLPKTKYAYINDEVIFFICSINISVKYDARNYDKLIAYLNDMEENSLLKAYMQGYVAVKSGRGDMAITFLEAAPKSSAYVKLPAIDYLLGNARLNRMDSDTPAALFNYLKEFRGINFIKDTYLKLAYYYLLKGDEEKYRYFLTQVNSKGYAVDEKDKEALKEANDVKPDLDLLKARFYFDGGYYTKALSQLMAKDINSLRLQRDKIEYYYRLGRIFEKLGKFNDAVSNYQRVINLGKATSYYYAANAALSTGKIFEDRKDFKQAADYYNQAIEMKDHEYKTSIDNDAKDGLKRINQ